MRTFKVRSGYDDGYSRADGLAGVVDAYFGTDGIPTDFAAWEHLVVWLHDHTNVPVADYAKIGKIIGAEIMVKVSD